MKVITQHVIIEEKEFVLIQNQNENFIKVPNNQSKIYYGTIPYSDIDEHGKLKRPLNGFDMCIGDTPDEAIRRRLTNLKMLQYMNENPNATDEMICKKAMELHSLIG